MLAWSLSRPRLRPIWLLVTGLCVCGVAVTLLSRRPDTLAQLRAFVRPSEQREEGPITEQEKVHEPSGTVVVVASQKGDDTTWLDPFSTWEKAVYVTDDPRAALTVPANKGREGMVYLTYIIDNYDKLPEVAIFSHSHRYQWHNDDPFYDGQAVLARFNLAHVRVQGYVNLRCSWTLGCPVSIRPHVEAEANDATSDPNSDEAKAGAFYKQAYEELFPGTPVPQTVGAGCCAQFAATAWKIRERPLSDYQLYRKWLLETPLKDDLSGRIFEYTWHIIFGQEAMHCPVAGQCYCKVFGLCRLPCEDTGSCRAAYILPPYSTLPQGWPEIDWDGQERNVTELRAKFNLENRPGPPRPHEVLLNDRDPA